ncbi:hypothetical protein D3C87_1578130 [compost metagenome]
MIDQVARMQQRFTSRDVRRRRAHHPGKGPDDLLDNIRVGHLIHADRDIEALLCRISASVGRNYFQLHHGMLSTVTGKQIAEALADQHRRGFDPDRAFDGAGAQDRATGHVAVSAQQLPGMSQVALPGVSQGQTAG